MSASISAGSTLLLGPANSGKMGLVLDWWRERLAAEALIVVPTGPDAREVTAEMVERVGALLGRPGAVTFDGLVRLVLGRVPRYAGELEATFMLAEVLGQCPLEALGGSTHLPGTRTALSALLRQLGESGKDDEEVQRILRRWAVADPTAMGLAGDIARLAADYAAALREAALEDRPAVVRLALERLRAEGPGAAAGWTKPVAFYGFTSFTPGQRALVDALSRHAEVLLVFTYDETRTTNLVSAAELGWWRGRVREVVQAPQRPRAYDSPAIAYLEQHFMCDRLPEAAGPSPSGDHSGVRFLLASGKRAEAELVAGEVAQLLRAGFRPRDIAVVVRQVSQWGPLLRDVFHSCAIPVWTDERRGLGQTGLGHAFLAGAAGVVADDPAGVLVYLRSPYSGVALELVADLELRYRRGTARGADALGRLAVGMGMEGVGRLWDVVGLTRPWSGIHLGRDAEVRGPRRGRARFQVAAAEGLIKDMVIAGSRGMAVGSEELEDDARAFRALRRAFVTLADLEVRGAEGKRFPSSSDAGAVLQMLAGVAAADTGALESDAVQVISVQRARARRFPVVVVLGLVEGEFPSRQLSPSLLTPAQRSRLDLIGGGLFVPEEDREGALFVSAVSRASRLLLLSARDAEDDGGQACISPYWQASRKLLGAGPGDIVVRSLADQVFALDQAPTPRHFQRACAMRGLPRTPATDPEEPAPAWERACASLRSSAVLADLGSTVVFSPSALESYLSCPFAWFVERVIGAEEVDFELDGRLVGQTLHSVLSAVYRCLESRGVLPLGADNLAQAKEAAAAIIERSVWSDTYPGTAAERRLAACKLRRMAGNVFEMDVEGRSTLCPHEMELWVGGKDGVDVGGLRIRGRLDRVDSTPEGRGLFVLDYKSGSVPSGSELGGEKGLQLPLYLLALAAERPQAAVLGGAYVSATDKKRSGVVAAGAEDRLGAGAEGCKVQDEETLDELFRKTREAALEAAAGMRAGIIAPRPDRRCPQWCRLGAACRTQRRGYRR